MRLPSFVSCRPPRGHLAPASPASVLSPDVKGTSGSGLCPCCSSCLEPQVRCPVSSLCCPSALKKAFGCDCHRSPPPPCPPLCSGGCQSQVTHQRPVRGPSSCSCGLSANALSPSSGTEGTLGNRFPFLTYVIVVFSSPNGRAVHCHVPRSQKRTQHVRRLTEV